MRKPLTKENFKAFILQNYQNKDNFDLEEFNEEIQRIKYIKKILSRTSETESRNRLLVNHVIILTNLFGIIPTMRMLFFKCDKEYHQELKTIFHFLKYLTFMNMRYIQEYDGVHVAALTIDINLLDKLENC